MPIHNPPKNKNNRNVLLRKKYPAESQNSTWCKYTKDAKSYNTDKPENKFRKNTAYPVLKIWLQQIESCKNDNFWWLTYCYSAVMLNIQLEDGVTKPLDYSTGTPWNWTGLLLKITGRINAVLLISEPNTGPGEELIKIDYFTFVF